jgi:hypothetical protein
VSGAPGPYNTKLFTFRFLRRRSAIIHQTVRCSTGLSGAPAEQRLTAQRSTTTDTCKRYSGGQFAQKSKQPPEAHRTVNRQCPVAHRTVRCAHRQQPPPTVVLVGEGYKYPSTTSTPTNQAFITLHSIHEQSATLQDTNQSHRSDQSPQFNSSALGLVRGSLVFLVALVCLAWLSFLSHFLLSSSL